jgi:hypothetical protein
VSASVCLTALSTGRDDPKVTTTEVAEKTMDGIIRNDPEVLVDETTQRVRSVLSGPLDLLYPSS